ncbi:hypothetical protein M3649_17825 [Ureibacillus chungkukjangi]|uniref:hypothetical protein n=1 Tax=Ureibacillus chungkukjangi TaxID=1202712 RepID=UPI00203EE9E9|nr:hypothetical protein [Ureibacillus chungkukjangi]MCM3389981.1 hypothetical protein [Ureibacillus chungkukjangi]
MSSELEKYITVNNDIPTQVEISGKQLDQGVNTKFLNAVGTKGYADSFTDSYKKGFVRGINSELHSLVNQTLLNMVKYTLKAVRIKKDDYIVNCTIKGNIDRTQLKLDEHLDVELNIPCHKQSSQHSNEPFKIFKSTIQVLLPIADYIDELEVHSSNYKIVRVVARMHVSRDDLDYLFEQPFFDIDMQTERRWMKILAGHVYELSQKNHSIKLSIPCVDGNLKKPIPFETRAKQIFFDGYEPVNVKVYRADT